MLDIQGESEGEIGPSENLQDQLALQDIVGSFRELRLQVLADELALWTKQPGRISPVLHDDLSLLVQAELHRRGVLRERRILATSRLRQNGPRFEELRWNEGRLPHKDAIVELTNLEWVRQGRTVVFAGGRELGKSWLSRMVRNP